jgi:hypothetical protein
MRFTKVCLEQIPRNYPWSFDAVVRQLLDSAGYQDLDDVNELKKAISATAQWGLWTSKGTATYKDWREYVSSNNLVEDLRETAYIEGALPDDGGLLSFIVEPAEQPFAAEWL